MLSFDFSGQTAIVTGGTRGIGAAISCALLQAGAEVVATYGGNTAAAEKFLAENGNGHLSLSRFNVADYAECEEFFNGFDKAHERLDILVASAGIRQDAVAAMMPSENWRNVLDVNLTGSFNCAKLAILRMVRARYGRIVFITSPVGRMGFPGQANYAASKAGLVGMAKSMARETARRGITVNCVSPGFIATDFIGNLPDEQVKEYTKMVPANRFGKPEEVASATLFLASREAAYITGTVLEISGGL